ncbi:MAG: RDD family protein [Nitrospirae bacterium]|nr:RDD family protein [Nitrospirota bacterium]
MTVSESLFDQPISEPKELGKAGFLNRIIARTIDFILVAALYEVIPKVGFFAGLTYLLIADGLFEGRSVGKKLIGLRVIIFNNTDKAAACTFKESILRNFPFGVGFILFGMLNVIPLIGWIFSSIVVIVVVLFESLVLLGSEEGMRLGDELAKTHVIEERQGGLDVP